MSELTVYKPIYKSLALDFNSAREEEWKADKYCYSALKTIGDLKKNNIDIELFLFIPLYRVYVHVTDYFQSITYMGLAAKYINRYAVEKCNANLTVFVNGISWTNGCVPRHWADLTELAGYDISGWNVCSIS